MISGTVRPSAFAVLRLMIRFELVYLLERPPIQGGLTKFDWRQLKEVVEHVIISEYLSLVPGNISTSSTSPCKR